MSKKIGALLSAAFVLGALLSASVAMRVLVSTANAASSADVIPGYDKDGQTVDVPNPDRH